MASRRIQRLNEQLKRELAVRLRRELRDPRVQGVTVTGVRAAPDLTYARVLIRVLGDEGARTSALEGLEAAAPYLRKALEGVFDAEIAAHLGEVLWVLDKHDEARAVWERALAEDPKHEYLLRTIGRHRVTQSVH